MKKIAILLTVLLSLAGCGNEDASKSQSATKPASNNTLTLSDGEKVSLNGELVKTIAKPNGKGALKLHEIKFDSGAKLLKTVFFINFQNWVTPGKSLKTATRCSRFITTKPASRS